MIDKLYGTAREAVDDVPDGATIAIGGFGGAGMPDELIDALIEQGARELTVVSNNAGNGDTGLAALLKTRRVRKLVCSFPRQRDAYVFEELYRAGQIELEVVPQGTLAERLRAAGSGIGAFYTPTGYGTLLAEGKETRQIDGRGYLLEHALPVDVALINAAAADRWGNLSYNKTARNFAPVMAMAANQTFAAVARVCELGELDPEDVVTPGIFVSRVVLRDGAVAPAEVMQAG
ncbi:3-oxoacid CoA-transferase subunit A [Cupriavidus necator]